MIKRILVGIGDAQFTASATAHAVELAKRSGASLTGVSILDIAGIRKETAYVPLGGGGFAADMSAAAFDDAHRSIDEATDKFVRLCEEANVAYEFSKVSGEPFGEFIERSKYHDLMVCGLRGLFEHGAIPEPKNELARLVASGVRPLLATASTYRTAHRVLIAYSNSVESAKTMRRFAQLSHLLAPRAEIQVVGFAKVRDEMLVPLSLAGEYLKAHGLDAEIKCVEGYPRLGVLQAAEEWRADLIVLGNSAKSLLRKQVFGETALHTISHADVPLFLSQ